MRVDIRCPAAALRDKEKGRSGWGYGLRMVAVEHIPPPVSCPGLPTCEAMEGRGCNLGRLVAGQLARIDVPEGEQGDQHQDGDGGEGEAPSLRGHAATEIEHPAHE